MSTEILIRPRSPREARRRVVAARSRSAKLSQAMRMPPGSVVDELPAFTPPPAKPRTNVVRLPVAFLNFPGRVLIDASRPMGSKYRALEQLWPVTAQYDEDEDRTRVGLSYMAPEPTQ